MLYLDKYLKYKNKYLKLKAQIAGSNWNSTTQLHLQNKRLCDRYKELEIEYERLIQETYDFEYEYIFNFETKENQERYKAKNNAQIEEDGLEEGELEEGKLEEGKIDAHIPEDRLKECKIYNNNMAQQQEDIQSLRETNQKFKKNIEWLEQEIRSLYKFQGEYEHEQKKASAIVNKNYEYLKDVCDEIRLDLQDCLNSKIKNIFVKSNLTDTGIYLNFYDGEPKSKLIPKKKKCVDEWYNYYPSIAHLSMHPGPSYTSNQNDPRSIHFKVTNQNGSNNYNLVHDISANKFNITLVNENKIIIHIKDCIEEVISKYLLRYGSPVSKVDELTENNKTTANEKSNTDDK